MENWGGMENLTPGTLLLDRFRIEERLGSGLIGVVYRAFDTQLQRTVALKILHPELFADSLTRARFIFGARVSRHLRPEQVVQLLDAVSTDDSALLVYEFMEGGSLADRIRDGNSLKVGDALRYAEHVAAILEEAHAAGVLHRALNPSAIFFDENGTLKIGEFGAADVPQSAFAPVFMRPLQTKNQRHALSYLAPEQIIRKKEDEPCDVYALAAILYHLLTGRPCLDFTSAETPDDLQSIVLTQMPLAPSQFNPRVPPWLDTVVLKALQKYPRFRFETIAEFRQALEAREFVIFAPVTIDLKEDEQYLKAQEKIERQHKQQQMRGIWHDTLQGAIFGFIGGLLLCAISYGVRGALVGWSQVLQENVVAACIVSTLLSTLAGAALGWIAHSDDSQIPQR
jgi:eukaryotic-like serine/threonine-protein kinase